MSKKRKGNVSKAARSSRRMPSGRRSVSFTQDRMQEALREQMLAKESIDAAEAKMISLGNSVLEYVMGLPVGFIREGKISDVDGYFDPPLTEGNSWFECPEPERVKGFWNLSTDRQVAFRNWCARLNHVRQCKDILMDVAGKTRAMHDEDDEVITREALDFVNHAGDVLEHYVDALSDVIDGAQTFIDGMNLDFVPTAVLVDTGGDTDE